MDYEDTTAFLGQWGRYQQIAFFLICASMVPNGLLIFAIVFAGDTPGHHCLVPKVNLSQDWRDAIIPIQVTEFLNTQLNDRRFDCLSQSQLWLEL